MAGDEDHAVSLGWIGAAKDGVNVRELGWLGDTGCRAGPGRLNEFVALDLETSAAGF